MPLPGLIENQIVNEVKTLSVSATSTDTNKIDSHTATLDMEAELVAQSMGDGTTASAAAPTADSSAVEFVVLGDANGDGTFNNDDILPFIQALTMPAAYAAAYPSVDPDVVLDMNDNGVFDNDDIFGFLEALLEPPNVEPQVTTNTGISTTAGTSVKIDSDHLETTERVMTRRTDCFIRLPLLLSMVTSC